MYRRYFIASTLALLATTGVAAGATDEELKALLAWLAWWRGAAPEHRGDTLKLLAKQSDERGRYHGDATVRSSSWWLHRGAEPAVVNGSYRGTFVYDPATQRLVITFDEVTVRYRVEGESLINVSTGEVLWIR